MSNLIHLFSVGQKVRCNMDGHFTRVQLQKPTQTTLLLIFQKYLITVCLKMISISRMFTRNIISNQLRR